MKPKREGLERRIHVVKNCGRRKGQNQAKDDSQMILVESQTILVEKIAEIAESQKVVLEKFAEIAESQKVVLEKFAEIAESHKVLLGKSSNEGHARRIASNLIEWKRKSQMMSEWPPKHVPLDQRIPQTPPNPLVSQLTEKRMKEIGMSSQICGRCRAWFRSAAVSKLCGECHQQNCESAATFFASATSATPAEFMPSLKPYGLREHFEESRDSTPPLHNPSWTPVVTIPRPPPPT